MRNLIFTFLSIVMFTGLSNSQVTTLWEKSATAGTKPAWETGSVNRGIASGMVGANARLYIVTRSAAFGGKQILIFNATSGDSVGMLDTTGLVGGLYAVNDVEVSSNGIIYVGNMTLDATTNSFKVYAYLSESAAPVEVINYTSTAAMRLGDKFTVTGSTADNSVTIWAAAANVSGDVVKFTTTDNGTTFTPQVLNVGTLVSFSSAAVGALANGDFYFNAHGMNAQKFSSTGSLIGTIPNTVLGTSGSSVKYLSTFLGSEYILANDLLTANNGAKIIKVPGGVPSAASLVGSTPVLGATSAAGLGDVSVLKISDYVYNVYVLATNNGFGAYQVDLTPQLLGDYYIPQGSNPLGFNTLNDAVATLNAGVITGAVNFLLDADTLRENSITFNANLSAINNVTVKPASGRNVLLILKPSASKGNGIQLIGFDKGHVTFDGSNNGSISRNLIVTTDSDAVAVPFGLNTSNADTVVLKNLVIKNLDNVTTNFRYGAVVNDKDGVWGFRVENCQIGTAARPVRRDGIAPWGATAPNQFSIVNNEIYCGTRGVATLYLTESEIIGNTINILPTTAAATDAYNHGIYITGQTGSLTISGNKINCLEKTINATSYLIGIAFAGNGAAETDVVNIANNMINVGAVDETRYTYGIGLRSAQNMGNLKIFNNTIVINNNASTLVSYGIGNHTTSTGAVNIDLKNNIIINNHSGNASSSAIGVVPATSVVTSNYNDLVSNQNLVNYQGTLYANLSAWQATTQDINSVSKTLNFVSATDLHLAGSSDGDIALIGTPLAGITTDIDGETRHITYPYMGADEATISLPIELTSFAATSKGNDVELIWQTATEKNSSYFEVQRKSDKDSWTAIGKVSASGTTTEKAKYSFTEKDVKGTAAFYRLKMVDLDGSYSYSKEVEVKLDVPVNFELSQNYPNPFNPSTTIKYAVPVDSKVRLEIYSMLGELVTTLVDDIQPTGNYTVAFDASRFASGTYIYRLTANNTVITKKMLLLK